MPAVMKVGVLRAPPMPIPQQGGGGALNFLDTFTVTGSGFGSKNTATVPQVWDYGQAGAGVLDSQWSGGHPISTATGKLQNYASGTHSMSVPHSHCQNMLA